VPEPELASIISAGQAASVAVDIGDGIYLSGGISNSYLVTTSEGSLVVNSGMTDEGVRHLARYRDVSDAPIRALVFTQSHVDHVGGWQAFAGRDVDIIVQSNFKDVRQYWNGLRGFYTMRSARLWGIQLGPEMAANLETPPEPEPTVHFDDEYSFTLGDRRFDLYSTPGGETLDSLVVWLPESRTLFTGNLFGPLFGHVPNLYTIRGDKIRHAQSYIRAVDRVLALQPAVLITGHGDPIHGEAEIASTLRKMRDAVQYLLDKTMEGMNHGLDVFTLMRGVTLPESLTLGEGHGKVSWNVRSIWEDHAGWFRYESTTELYSVAPRAIWNDVLRLAGGPDGLIDAANDHLAQGRPVEALHLLDIALTDPTIAGLQTKRRALQQLSDSSQRRNLSETRWLDSEITAITTSIAGTTEKEGSQW